MMNHTTPTVAGRKLSSSLKERLKRCGRYHASPSPVTMATKVEQYASPSPVTKSKIHDQQTSCTTETLISKQLCSVNGSSQVAKQPLSELASPAPVCNLVAKQRHGEFASPEPNFKKQSSLTETPVSKRQYLPLSSGNKPVSNKRLCLETPSPKTSSGKGNMSTTAASIHSRIVSSEGSVHTPLTTRSNIKSKIIKGNKLDFDEKDVTDHSSVDGNNGKQIQLNVDNNQTSGHGAAKTPACDTTEKELKKAIQDHEEKLRKLKMVKMYRSKNNLTALQVLIERWRAVSQQGLQDLHRGLPEPRPSLTQLLDHLGIEHQLIRYNQEEESFE